MTASETNCMRILVFEKKDRWTKLIRRRCRKRESVEVAQVPSLQFLTRILDAETGNFIALDVDDKNVDEVVSLLARHSNSAQNHRFVAFCRDADSPFPLAIRHAGAVACFFSLIDVESVVRLARCHFSEAKSGRSDFNRELPLEEKIWQELPQFQ